MKEGKREGAGAARLALAWAVTALVAAAPAAGVEPVLASIATGGKTGVYYLAGGAICGFVDARALGRPGSAASPRARTGRSRTCARCGTEARTFGLVQSDWQHHAFYGSDVFRQAGPDRDLRSVVSLFREPFTVIARPDAGIGGIADLKGKRVSLGPAGSGGRATMGVVMEAMGWTDDDFAYVDDLAMAEVAQALCAGEIDAAVFIVAHPEPDGRGHDVVLQRGAGAGDGAGDRADDGGEHLLRARRDRRRHLRRSVDRRAELRGHRDAGDLVADLAGGRLRGDQGAVREFRRLSRGRTRPSPRSTRSGCSPRA